jgi:DNA/RNA endonuclease YhcR with UshA esterase domain
LRGRKKGEIMKNIKTQFIFLSIILLGFFIWQKNVSATETNIVISEIAAYETSNYEWFEIYNLGSEPIDITNWKFFENETNHSLNQFQNDLIIEPQEYAIIADVAENFLNNFPDFNGTIIDSSWTSLKEDGEEIGLKNSANEIIELFTYLPCPDASLQKIDLNLNDYSDSNWQVHAIDNSAGQPNEFDQQYNEELEDNEPYNDSPDVNNQRIVAGSILINEFVADPVSGEAEWIELYNKNIYDIDLTGWQILDGSDTSTPLEGTISASNNNPFLIIESPKGKLNNSGDTIILQDKDGNILDTVNYGNYENLFIEKNAPAAADPFSVARIEDGGNTNNNQTDFVITQTPSKGSANIITLIEEEEKEADVTEIGAETEDNEKIEKKEKSDSQIIINEIYPNPPGSDLVNEWIELKNNSELVIDLADWKIQDNDKMLYKISKEDFADTALNPGYLFIIPRDISGLALNNDQETVKLIDPNNQTVQTIKYKEQADLIADAAYALDQEGTWQWTSLATKKQHNLFIPVNHPPMANIYCPKQAEVNQQIICDASDSFDFENNKLQFSWKIQNQTITEDVLKYTFSQSGNFQISLSISDGAFEVSQNHNIKIISPKTDDKIEKITTPSEKGGNKNPDLITSIELKEIKAIEQGTEIKTQGVVSVLPNTFGKTTMYLAGSGVQLYMYKADWPELQLGDLVEVSGSITESKGETRIKLAQQEDIRVLAKQIPPQPHQIKINEIGENTEGYLVQFTGQLIEKSGSRFYFQDETGEAEIYIKNNTKIPKTNYKEGDDLLVTGIVSQDNEIYQVLLDINHEQEATLAQNNKNQSILKYLMVGAGFLLICLGIVFYKIKKTR